MSNTARLATIPIYDGLDPCPYLPGQVARLPLHYPLRRLSGAEFDLLLADGYRRLGDLVYRASCPRCQACEPLRVLVDEFQPNRAQRRAARRGHEALTVEMARCHVDPQRLELYNAHKRGRNLDRGEGPIDAEGYRSFLVDTCCDSFELRFFAEGRLIGVAVADRGEKALSAVYCYFDPALAHLSPGTFSILRQIELCRQWGLTYLYLGYYIAPSCPMTYKAAFRPHERLQDGQWVRHE
jgi:arginine-tRNA-protein transferase